MRFHAGMEPPLPLLLDELVDERLDLEDMWGNTAERLGAAVAAVGIPNASHTADLLADRNVMRLHTAQAAWREVLGELGWQR